MSDLYRINMAPGATDGGGLVSSQNASPSSGGSDYSGISGSFSRQSDQPTTSREALEPQTESRGTAPAVGEPAVQADQGAGAGLGAPGSPSPGSTPAPSQPSPWDALRSTAKGMGIELPQDDQAALHALVSAYQNAGKRDYYAELGQAIAPQYSQYQQWQQAQQAAAQQSQQKPQSPWNPPAFDQNWLRVVEEDPQTGRLRSKQGYDPRFGEACQAYADYINQAQRSLWENPPQFIENMIGPTVQRMIQQGIQGSFQGYQEQVQANNIIQRNMDWLYAKDQNNRIIYGQNGRPQLSPHGTRYYQYVEQAAGWGMNDINQQHDYAVSMVERDAYRAQRQANQGVAQQAAPALAQQAPAGAQRAANVNQLQTMVPPSRKNVQPTNSATTGLSLAEMLRQDLRDEGIDDNTIRAQMAGTV